MKKRTPDGQLRYRGTLYQIRKVLGHEVVGRNPETGRDVSVHVRDLVEDDAGTWIHSSCLSESEIERWRELAGVGPKIRPTDHRAALRLLTAMEV